MLDLLKEDGVLCSQGAKAGIMKKQSTYWSCEMVGTSEVKKWTDPLTQRWLMIAKQDILPKLEERCSGLRPLFESATEKAREQAEKALRPFEAKILAEIRAEKKKAEDDTKAEREKSVREAHQKLDTMKRNLDVWMRYISQSGSEANIQECVFSNLFTDGKIKSRFFIDKLGNKVRLGLVWSFGVGAVSRYDWGVGKLNELWRRLNRMDGEDKAELDYLEKSAADDINTIQGVTMKVDVIDVERPNGDRFIPAVYMNDWINARVSPADLKERGKSFLFQTDGIKPTNAEEDRFYGAMCDNIRSNMKGEKGYGLDLGFASAILPSLIAEFSQDGTGRSMYSLWDGADAKFMKWAFGNSLSFE
jgi:hypothetical protein